MYVFEIYLVNFEKWKKLYEFWSCFEIPHHTQDFSGWLKQFHSYSVDFFVENDIFNNVRKFWKKVQTYVGRSISNVKNI